MVLIVTYDLHAPGRDYRGIGALLNSARDQVAHPQGSTWFLDTDRDPHWWLDRLRERADHNDEFFVAQLQRNWWSVNTDSAIVDWLKSPARTW